MRITVFAMIAAIGFGVCGAASAQMGGIPSGRAMIEVPSETEPAIQIVDPEKMKDEIAKLKKENKKLKIRNEDLMRERDGLRKELAAYTAKGGHDCVKP